MSPFGEIRLVHGHGRKAVAERNGSGEIRAGREKAPASFFPKNGLIEAPHRFRPRRLVGAGSTRNPVVPIVLLALTALVWGSFPADAAERLDEIATELGRTENVARGSAVLVLKQLKVLRAQMSAGSPSTGGVSDLLRISTDGVSPDDLEQLAPFVEKLAEVRRQASELHREAEALYRALPATASDGATMDQIRSSYEKIAKYHDTVLTHWTRFQQEVRVSTPSEPRVKFSGSILMAQQGSTSYTRPQVVQGGGESSGGTHNYQGNLKVQIEPDHYVTFNARNERTFLQTPAAHSGFDAGYNRQVGNLSFAARTGYLAYDDESLDVNDYDNSSIGASLSHDTRLNSATFSVDRTSRSFESSPLRDHNQTLASGKYQRRFGDEGRDRVGVQLNAVFQDSDTPSFSHDRITPRVELYKTWSRERGLELDFATERQTFDPGAEVGDYNRHQGTLAIVSNGSGRRSRAGFRFIQKNFPNVELASYQDFAFVHDKQASQPDGTSISQSVVLNYRSFPNADIGASYLELSLQRSKLGSTFRRLGIYARYWRERNSDPVKAHVVDLYYQVGRRTGAIRFGPFVGAHLLAFPDPDSVQGFFETPGNQYRGGLEFAALQLPVGRAFVDFQVTAEGARIYDADLSAAPISGQSLPAGTGRMTINTHGNFMVNVPLDRGFAIFATGAFYRNSVRSDLAMNPLGATQNPKKVAFDVGVRYAFGNR